MTLMRNSRHHRAGGMLSGTSRRHFLRVRIRPFAVAAISGGRARPLPAGSADYRELRAFRHAEEGEGS